MTEPTRWIAIDDRDLRIQYSGSWDADIGGSWNTRGNFGETYLNTLQGSSRNQSSLSFRIVGDAARIIGSNEAVVDIDWDCILNGTTVLREEYNPIFQNNWVFCSFSNLVAGEHTIGLQVKTSQTEKSLWFDQIQYRPTGVEENEVVIATRDDADLEYSSGWQSFSSTAHYTRQRGSTATFRFIGTGVSLWGVYQQELPRNPGNATYTLDGGSPVSFTIPGGEDTSHSNRKIFEITGLPRVAHSIRLEYTSSGQSTPLVVARFLIEGGTNLRASTGINGGSPTSTPVSSATGGAAVGGPSSSSSGGGGTSVGTIIGAVLGALALTAILGLAWYYFARRRRLRLQDISSTQFRIPPDDPSMVAIGAATPPPHQPHPAAQTKRSLVSSGRSFSGHFRQTSTNSPISTVPPTTSTAQAVYHEGSLRSRAAGEDFEERPPTYSDI